jgi:hypothetical protein
VIDDLGLQPLATQQAADLLEIIEDRAQRRSTIVTSQLPIALWHEALGEPHHCRCHPGPPPPQRSSYRTPRRVHAANGPGGTRSYN